MEPSEIKVVGLWITPNRCILGNKRCIYIEIEDGPLGILKGLVQYGTAERPTSYGLFNSNGGQSWTCDSDNPSSNCHFTDEEGRHWGQWSHLLDAV